MAKEFSAILERDGEWFIAYSPDIPAPTARARTASEALASMGRTIIHDSGGPASRRDAWSPGRCDKPTVTVDLKRTSC